MQFKNLNELKAKLAAGEVANEITCSHAAKIKSLECLQYLREKVRCPWNDQVLAMAYGNKDSEIIEYAWNNRCPLTVDIWPTVFQYGTIKDVTKCREAGLEWGDDQESNMIDFFDSKNSRYDNGFFRDLVDMKYPFPDLFVGLIMDSFDPETAQRCLEDLSDVITIKQVVKAIRYLNIIPQNYAQLLVLCKWIQEKMIKATLDSDDFY